MNAQPSQSIRTDHSALWLWASAVVLVGLIIVQLGKVPPAQAPGVALAEVSNMGEVSRVGDYTLLTFNAGNDDVLAVLDGRNEELYFYRVKNQTQLDFVARENLNQLFANAKRLGPGRK